MQELEDPENKLESTDKALFQRIISASGKLTVQDYFSKAFARGSDEHNQLRNLRDRKLVRPAEGGRWEAGKHPVVTRFGELVLQVSGASTNAG